MIQRVQSLILLLIAIMLVALLFVPIWERGIKTTEGSEKLRLTAFKATHLHGDQVVAEKSVWYISVAALVAAGVALFSIFKYKNRLVQIKLGLLNALVLSGVLGTIFLGIRSAGELEKGEKEEEFLFGFFIPIIALILNLLANRFIRRDEKLVRSADRIR